MMLRTEKRMQNGSETGPFFFCFANASPIFLVQNTRRGASGFPYARDDMIIRNISPFRAKLIQTHDEPKMNPNDMLPN